MNLQYLLAPVPARNCAVALGFFDGVHLGHRRVLQAAVAWARERGCTPAAFTFSLPADSRQKGVRILTPTQKHARMQALGIRECVEPPFESFRSLSPAAFVEEILIRCFDARAVFCGSDFTFGAHAVGRVDLLQELCAAHHIAVHVVPTAKFAGQDVSSTRIRAALETGNIKDANAMLVEPYALDWTVVHGKGLGSSRLGTPTINQQCPVGALLPCEGVYLTRIDLGGKWRPAATGIGPRPTVDAPGAAPSCETYVPEFAGDVYGWNPTLEFHAYYGPVRKYDDLAQLRAVILQAGDAARTYFSQKAL